jgi:hypothetical protein
MGTVLIDGVRTTVRELARPRGWPCRLLQASPSGEYVLEYLVSVGPYKIDVCQYHRLSGEEVERYGRGHLQLAALAAELAGEAPRGT